MNSVHDTPKGGLPHSEIFGSKDAPASPKLIAGCHVFRRLSSPRHSPDALLALEIPHTQTPTGSGEPINSQICGQLARTSGRKGPNVHGIHFVYSQCQRSHSPGRAAGTATVFQGPTKSSGKPFMHTSSDARFSLATWWARRDRTVSAKLSRILFRLFDHHWGDFELAGAPTSTGNLVEPDGIEPTTSGLQSRRSPS
jgi:hypothetical protein